MPTIGLFSRGYHLSHYFYKDKSKYKDQQVEDFSQVSFTSPTPSNTPGCVLLVFLEFPDTAKLGNP